VSVSVVRRVLECGRNWPGRLALLASLCILPQAASPCGEEAKDQGGEKKKVEEPKIPPFKCSAWCAFRDYRTYLETEDLMAKQKVDPAKTEQRLVQDMAKSGCKEVSLGFESGNENILHAMNKKFKPDDVRAAAALFKESGVRRMGFLLLGGPGETEETVEESLSFADSLNLDMMKVSIGIRIYPNTRLAKVAAEEGMISADDTLLFPKFYIRKDLEDWLYQTVRSWLSTRANWIM